MGNNQAFTDFEATVLATYNKGVLDKELLSAFMEIHRGQDIDSGGFAGTLAQDGFDCIEISLKIFGVTLPPKPDLPEDFRQWTEVHEEANEAWRNAYWEEFYKITANFGW